MTNDASNPFQKLAKELAARKSAPDGAESCQKNRPASGVRGKMRDGKAPSDEDEAALFRDAVSRIKPLPGKTVPSEKARTGNEGVMPVLALAGYPHADPEENEEAGAKRKKNEKERPGEKARLTGSGLPEGKAERSFAASGPPRKSATGADPAPREETAGGSFPAAMRNLFAEPPEAGASPEEEALFAQAMRGVAPVSGKGRDVTAPAAQGKKSLPSDPAKALRDVLEGRVEFALHHTDEYMEGFVVGVDPLVLARLRNGQYSPEKHLDLHGMNARQAYDALTVFIREAYQRGLRTLVIVTGRGKNSPDGVGVLRLLLQRWLSRDPFKRVVLAFCTAKARDGGPGAVYALLRKYKKSRGKIIWDYTPSDDDFPDA
jgi:DNA-nicking Smr family endonuclease